MWGIVMTCKWLAYLDRVVLLTSGIRMFVDLGFTHSFACNFALKLVDDSRFNPSSNRDQIPF